MLIERLPAPLEDVDALMKRRHKAAEIREMWRSTYSEAYRFAMPARETFSWTSPGASRTSRLYDSTLQEATYNAANTTVANLFPPWSRWAELGPGSEIPKEDIDKKIREGLQRATETFFDFLNHSEFNTVIHEVVLDLMVGTGALLFNEGTDDRPFEFTSIPSSVIEIEEGPNGAVETTFMERKPCARNLLRMYPGMEWFDLSPSTQDALRMDPNKEIRVIQCEVYYPENKHYYGIVVELESRTIAWRYDYGMTCPTIVARATKVAGETYGRGRVLLALSDARTLDKMVEFVLRQAAIQLAPPMTGVSDGVLNPYTAVIAPQTVIPVASNDQGNPSLRVLDVGGNFQIAETLLTAMRERVQRVMLGPEPSEGAVKSATEISVSDRNRLWAMNGEYSRILAELIEKIVKRGVAILQKRGLIPKFKIDGRMVAIQWNSPFAKSQSSEDVMALQTTLATLAAINPAHTERGLKLEKVPGWAAQRAGVDETLIRSEEELAEYDQKVADAAEQAAQMSQENPEMAQSMMKVAGG